LWCQKYSVLPTVLATFCWLDAWRSCANFDLILFEFKFFICPAWLGVVPELTRHPGNVLPVHICHAFKWTFSCVRAFLLFHSITDSSPNRYVYENVHGCVLGLRRLLWLTGACHICLCLGLGQIMFDYKRHAKFSDKAPGPSILIKGQRTCSASKKRMLWESVGRTGYQEAHSQWVLIISSHHGEKVFSPWTTQHFWEVHSLQ